MLKSPANALPFFHIKTYLSLTIILVPLPTAYDTLFLKIDIPIIARMQAPRLLGVQFKAQDSDHLGHRTHTSVLSLLTRQGLCLHLLQLHDASTLPAFRRLSLGRHR